MTIIYLHLPGIPVSPHLKYEALLLKLFLKIMHFLVGSTLISYAEIKGPLSRETSLFVVCLLERIPSLTSEKLKSQTIIIVNMVDFRFMQQVA
jgi:hypothetical protein